MFGIICILISQLQGFFAKSYGTDRSNKCFSVIQTQDQGYAMAGYSGEFYSNGSFLVVKTDSTGALSWAYEYYRTGGTYDEFAWPIVQAADGSYYVGGHAFDDFNISNDIVLMKLNSSGGILWTKSYGVPYPDLDYAHSMVMLSDGGLAIAGHTIPGGQQDIIVMKLTPNGDVVWAKKYSDVNQDHAYGVIQTSDGKIVVSGFTVRSGSSDFDILVICLDGFGNTLWAKTYGTSGQNDFGYSVAQLADGNLVVDGYLGGYGGGVLKIRLSDGALLWAKAFADANLDYFYRPQITRTSDGGFILPAFSSSFGAGSYDFLIMKFASNGDLEWARTFGGGNYEIPTCIIEKPDGRFAIAGMTISYGVGNWDFALLILRSDGTFPGACVATCNPPASSPSLSTYTVASLSDWSYTKTDLSYERVDPGISVRPICDPLYESEDEHHSGSNARIIARPCQGGASFLSPEPASIKIYLADGRLAYSGMLQKGDNRIELDQGVYFWRAGKQSGRIAVR